MEQRLILVFLMSFTYAAMPKTFCGKSVLPLEIGSWSYDLSYIDSATIEDGPASSKEGKIYVYENTFPNRTIQYIHVDNLARKSCGASASLKAGGVGHSSVMIVLHANRSHDVRSVIEIWGTKKPEVVSFRNLLSKQDQDKMNTLKSVYLVKDKGSISQKYRKNMFINRK